MRRALITGITGQDGMYLAESLLADGYEVHGLVRRSSSFNRERFSALLNVDTGDRDRLRLHYGDLGSGSQLIRIVSEVEPHEIYNLGAQSHVRESFDAPVDTADIVALGAIRLLEAIRGSGLDCRFYQASSSEMFGDSPAPQSETTPFRPRSPYAVAKVHAHWATINYRDAYGIHASTGILFNHESPRRGESFLTRKVALAVPQLLLGTIDHLALGNLEARRDWGHARDYMRAARLIIDHDVPDDFVIGTGVDHSVEEFVRAAFDLVGLEWEDNVRIDPVLYRPTEVMSLRADASKARDVLGWEPEVGFDRLVREMVGAEMAAAGLPFEVG